MADQPVLLAFNRGVISTLGLARVDLNRTALSASIQTNFVPRTLGPMTLRPGLEYIATTDGNNKAKMLPFVFANRDTALIEVTDSKVRVFVDEAVVTRASVSTSITNGVFTSDVTSWTDNDEAGATSAWVTGGYLGLAGNGTAAAIREQQLSVSGGDQNTLHALDIVVERGPVTLKVGSTSGAEDYIAEATLLTGVHSLSFTPTGANVFVEFSSNLERQVLVDSVAIASSGAMELAAPWAEADLYNLRITQSGDVIFVACDGYQQRRIERRSTTSWSVVLYETEDGPYKIENVGPTTLTASAITGNITLTASKDLFKSTHVGALFSITSAGQRVEADVSAENSSTDSIRVTGTSSSRQFSIEIAGTWVGTVTLQRSIGDEGTWEDVSGYTWTSNVTTTYNDGLANQIVYYRLIVKTGDYTSGTAELALDYAIGSIRGVVRITAYSSATSASAEVIKNLGGTDATDTWSEGAWSDYSGWPSTVALDEGRLWWWGKDKIWGSVSDAFNSFDPDTEGDSGPISRSIGEGPVDTIHWALPLLRLVFGAGGAAYVIKSSSLDEPLTPTAFNLKSASTQGCAQVNAVKVDASGIYVQKSGTRIHELVPDGSLLDYTSVDLTAIAPEIGEPGIVTLGVQRTPDTRIHCVRSDGKVALLVHDPAEDVRAWLPIETPGASGKVEDVVVLPGDEEDKVYYVVNRTIGGSTVRYLEKWALERESRGRTFTHDGASTTTLTDVPYRDGTKVTVRDSAGAKVENLTVSNQSVTLSAATTYCTLTPSVLKLGDSFATYSGASTSTMTGLDHLEGEDVVVFADGVALKDASGDIETFEVSSGSITLTNEGATYSAEEIMAGLSYTAKFKSSKLAYAAQVGTALSQSGKVSRVGLILVDTHAKGIQFGQSFDDLQEMPDIEDGTTVDADYLWSEYDKSTMPFPSTWGVDSRICLQASAPRPATVAAVPFVIEKHSKV
jgi:hypothetical protein